jgi:hypothetical protein
VSMTVTQLVQLYAPLAGLLIIAFWLGVLSQRVKQLESNMPDSKMLARLEVKVEAIEADLQGIRRDIHTIQRQLGNLMTGGAASIVKFSLASEEEGAR